MPIDFIATGQYFFCFRQILIIRFATTFTLAKIMIEIFHVEQSPKTPFIELRHETGVFQINGKSVPENTVQFYSSLFEWLNNYAQAPAKSTTLNIQLDYFNTSSAKVLADLFKKLENLQNNGKSNVTINWYYQDIDEEMLEAGEGYKSITKVPFNLVPFTK